MHAIDLANALAEFEPYWFEEPCQSENVEALAEVRHASRIPVVTGEALLDACRLPPDHPRARRRHHQSRRFQLRRHSRAHVHCGGRRNRGDRRVAAQLQFNHHGALAPPCTPPPACQTSSSPNISSRSRSSGQRLCPNALRPVNGYIALPEGPGLGLDVDETAVRAAKGKQFPARTFRSLAEEGP